MFMCATLCQTKTDGEAAAEAARRAEEAAPEAAPLRGPLMPTKATVPAAYETHLLLSDHQAVDCSERTTQLCIEQTIEAPGA